MTNYMKIIIVTKNLQNEQQFTPVAPLLFWSNQHFHGKFLQNVDIKCTLRIVALAKNTTNKAHFETVCKYIQCLCFILKL